MKQLMIMRHAKSSWKDGSLADHDRPLNRRGRANAPEMGRFLNRQLCLPTLILCSTARRAQETAQLLVQGSGQAIPITSQRALYHAGLSDYQEAIATHTEGQSRVMVVSHNPGSEEWLYQLTGQYERMPTAAIALVQFQPAFAWAEIADTASGNLQEIWRPRDVLMPDDQH